MLDEHRILQECEQNSLNVSTILQIAQNNQADVSPNNFRSNTTDFDPIKQKIDQVHKKIRRLEAHHERLASDNRQFHQRMKIACRIGDK